MTAPINKDLDALAEPFRAKAYRLVELIQREGLPFVVFETRRSFSRSSDLFMIGREYKNGVVTVTGPVVTRARAGESPHNWGLAMDCVLDVKSDWWEQGEGPALGPWDTGYTKGKLVRPHVKLAWERYGRCVRQADLTWGGDWVGFVDIPHAELKQWRTLRPSDWKTVAQREVEAGR